MHKYTVHVPQHAPRMNLGNYVRRAFPLLPEHAVRSAFLARDIKMNGVRCGRDASVLPGAEICVYTPWQICMPIAFENDRILAVDKPRGVSCDADAFGSMTVLDWAYLHANGAYTPRMCHRLDNQTSGLVLLAKDEASETALKEMFSAHTGVKEYCCVVRGTPQPPAARCSAWLLKDAARGRVRIQAHAAEGAKQIETAYEVLQPGEACMVRVRLYTGRTHQIRAHMAWLGHPVLGDDLYGDRAFNKRCGMGRLMLRAVRLGLDTQGKMPELDGIEIEVPLKTDHDIK